MQIFDMSNSSKEVEWYISKGLTDYREAEIFMEARAKEIWQGLRPEAVWLLEHPPLYTAGTSAQKIHLISPDRFPVYVTKRGGQYTYHGPGQRVAYVMLDLNKRGKDVRAFVKNLESWVIGTLQSFNIQGEIRDERVGVWVQRPEKPRSSTGEICEDKIAAIGIRLRKWVSFHGISINVEPNIEHFSGIVPCGITDYGVTSLLDLGLSVKMADLDSELAKNFKEIFLE